jgi:glucose-6-phosphate-specific signal transduction histidine kinase
MPNPLFALITFLPGLYAAFLRNQILTPDFTIELFLIKVIALLSLTSLLAFAILKLVYKIVKRIKSVKTQFLFYLLGIFCTVFFCVQVWIIANPLETLTNTQLMARAFFLFYTYNLIWGVVQQRANRDALQMRELLEKLRNQQTLLIDADENARVQVAEYLHNNVQSGLVVIGLQLREIAAGLDFATKARISSTIDELENIRLNEIRSASRRLTPNLELVPLEQALHGLIDSYGSSIQVKVNLDEQISHITSTVAMAVYRISEQALLNALVHANATTCQIYAFVGIDQKVDLKITNDGLTLASEQPIQGTGFAVIDAWVTRCDGSWKLYSDDSTRTVLSAIL